MKIGPDERGQNRPDDIVFGLGFVRLFRMTIVKIASIFPAVALASASEKCFQSASCIMPLAKKSRVKSERPRQKSVERFSIARFRYLGPKVFGGVLFSSTMRSAKLREIAPRGFAATIMARKSRYP